MRAGLVTHLIQYCQLIVLQRNNCARVVCGLAVGLLFIGQLSALEPFGSDPASSRETQADATRRIPMQQLKQEIRQLIEDVVDNPSFFRRMPSTAIQCDPEMFQHLVRHPEVLVNIWDVMGITKVQAKRTGPYAFTADDGVGTVCKCDLVYGNDQVHVYYGTGAYKGNMAPRQINGRCVCVLYNTNVQSHMGEPVVKGAMDVFLKLDNLGADLLTRTLGPLVGKTADNNFTESAKFLSQISQICEYNPAGAQILASKLTKVQPEVRDEFRRIATRIGDQSGEPMNPQDVAIFNNRREPSSMAAATTRRDSNDAVDQANAPGFPSRFPDSGFSDLKPADPRSLTRPPHLIRSPVLGGSVSPSKPNVYMRR
jgi:hypothetical protein